MSEMRQERACDGSSKITIVSCHRRPTTGFPASALGGAIDKEGEGKRNGGVSR